MKNSSKLQIALFITVTMLYAPNVDAQSINSPSSKLEYFKLPIPNSHLQQKPTTIQSRIIATTVYSAMIDYYFIPKDSTHFYWNGNQLTNFSGINLLSGSFGFSFENKIQLKPSILKNYPDYDSSYLFNWNGIYGDPQNKMIYEKNQVMDIVLLNSWNLDQMGWNIGYQEENTYDTNHQRTSLIRSGWNTGNTLINEYKEAYSYDTGGNLTQYLYQDWELNQWRDEEKNDYTYDVNNNWLSATNFFWDGSQWIGDKKMSFSYNNNKRVSELDQVWSNGAWQNDSLETYTYDSMGNWIGYVIQTWNSNAMTWENLGKINYTYDVNGNNTSTIYFYDDNNAWMESMKFTYSYNSQNMLTEMAVQAGSGQQLSNVGRFLFSYNSYEQLLSFTTNTWDFNTNQYAIKEGDIQYLYYYEEFDDGTAIDPIKNPLGFNLYPNPANNSIFVEVNGEKVSHYRIIDILGKTVSFSDVPSKTKFRIPLNQLSNGIYILQLKNEKTQNSKIFRVQH